MNKFLIGIKSRTVWVIIVMVIINGVPSVRELLPAESLPMIDSALGILAIIFRVNPQAGVEKKDKDSV